MKKILILSLVVGGLMLSGCAKKTENLAVNNPDVPLTIIEPSLNPQVEGETTEAVEERPSMKSDQVILKTDKGEIKIKLYPEAAPKTVKNFLDKAVSDYYKGLTFHRVEDWVVQGGDPLGNGTGGGDIPTELSKLPFKLGSVGVARAGDIKVSNDSQFFICTKDCSFLNEQYTIFGEVIEGMEIVNQTQIGDQIVSITPQEQ
jgi:peptidyl-prolyl cis-trans isomerase B (cyclophilin B)